MTAAIRSRAAGAALSVALALLASPNAARAWGLAAHAMITRQAVDDCPEPLRRQLSPYRDALVERSLEPDTRLRARDGRRESVRHFLNLEMLDDPPFTRIPADAKAARARYGDRRLDRAGGLPWSAGALYRRVVAALRAGDRKRAVVLMGHLAHYAADAHSPLHSTTNYDGRRTGNDGIHRRYESALIERRAKYFRRAGAPATVPERRIEDVPAHLLAVLREGHAGVGPILAADLKARRAGEPGSPSYLDALFGEVGPSARERMRAAARDVAALWTSAWLEAGRPRLADGGQ